MLNALVSSETTGVDLQQLKTLVPLKSMMTSHLTALIESATSEVVFAGQTVFEQRNDSLQHIYLLHGDVEFQYQPDRSIIEKARSRVYPLTSNQPLPSKAVAKSDCSVLRIERGELDKMLTWSQIAEYLLVDIAYQRDLDEDVDWMMTVLKSNLFFKVPPINVLNIFSRLKPVVVEAGDVILRQGELGDHCYFIKEGEAEVTSHQEGGKSAETLAVITVGRCFGEDALLNETVRNATVTMRTNGVLMRLDKRDFILLLKETKATQLENLQLVETLERGAVCIDVRTEDEYVMGHIKRAVNIPLNLLRLKSRLLTRETPYVLCCDTGRRSEAAAHLLREQGFNTVALAGGLRAIPEKVWAELEDTELNFLLRNGQVVQGH